MRKIVIAAFAVLIIAAVFIFIRGDEDAWICEDGRWVAHGNPENSAPTDACPGSNSFDSRNPVITIPGESFQKEGNLAKKDGALGFLYEEPGKPAIFVKLVFVADAMCGNGSATSSCAIMGSAGDRVTVEGRKDKDTVFVSKLTVITR